MTSLYNSKQIDIMTFDLQIQKSTSTQGHDMYKIEQLNHEQNSILGIGKVSDFPNHATNFTFLVLSSFV